MTPKVSVVTSVYNGARFFERAIPSILSQTYDDFEFILVDDGSNDGTLDRLREVAAQDRRIRVFAPGRQGTAAACNFGIVQAKGEYIVRQDFDDLSYPDRIRLQAAFLDSHPDWGIVGGAYLLVDERRGERYVRMPAQSHAEIIASMARGVPIAHTFATFRKRVWEEAGGYPPVNNLIDLRFYLRIAKVGWRFANLAEVMGEHFVHDSSFFHRTYTYAQRQRDLAWVQAQVVRELRLPSWMYVFALGRFVYPYIPDRLKRQVRRRVAGSRERDV
jgi:glycosyltransferase involved in cell wall biosynthesis